MDSFLVEQTLKFCYYLEMGRTKEFKHEEALNKAMHLFWENGYEQTSLKDLLCEMNILNGSFYNSFKNKKNLFLMALDHYTSEHAHEIMEEFNSNKSFKKGIRDFFESSLKCGSIDRPAGCFLVNCATSQLIDDPEIGDAIKEKIDGFFSFITDKFTDAQENGELSKELDPKKIITIAMSYLHGRMQITKLYPHNRQSKKQIEYLLNSLGI